MITYNNELKGDKYLLSVSGGKDSTAMILHMKESLIDPELIDYVFMDTGWEDNETYSYLEYLESELDIKINRIRANLTIKEEHNDIYQKCLSVMNRKYSDFVVHLLNCCFFPTGFNKWCTIRLKIDPFTKFINDSEFEYINCLGIRKDESTARSTLEMWEYNTGFNCWVYRPLIDWLESDVIEIHKRHNVRPNPLYLKGSHRVGCYPCIMTKKREMQNIPATHCHIEVIRLLEDYVTKYRNKPCTFFKRRNIHEVLNWSKTAHGGKQYQLFDYETVAPSCEKWGMCGV